MLPDDAARCGAFVGAATLPAIGVCKHPTVCWTCTPRGHACICWGPCLPRLPRSLPCCAYALDLRHACISSHALHLRHYACIASHVRAADVEGFQVSRRRSDKHGRLQAEIDDELKGKVFYYDSVHPDGNTGHRIMGELGAQLILDAWAQVGGQ